MTIIAFSLFDYPMRRCIDELFLILVILTAFVNAFFKMIFQSMKRTLPSFPEIIQHDLITKGRNIHVDDLLDSPL